MFSTDQIYQWLEEVKDPEIPVLSLVDLGVINAVHIHGDTIKVELTPTFVGCPALDMMKQDITELLKKKGAAYVEIEVTFRNPWTSDRISKKGKEALKKFGLAPPPDVILGEDLSILEYATCPRCGKTNTEMKSAFGATLCRAIYYCHVCKEAFEQFKPI
jgi:ring-1,2-phenylacetyl-CoA epoxidase subunit PaaD